MTKSQIKKIVADLPERQRLPLLLKVEDLVELLQVDKSTISRHLKNGGELAILPKFDVSPEGSKKRHWRFYRDSVLAFVIEKSLD